MNMGAKIIKEISFNVKASSPLNFKNSVSQTVFLEVQVFLKILLKDILSKWIWEKLHLIESQYTLKEKTGKICSKEIVSFYLIHYFLNIFDLKTLFIYLFIYFNLC